MLRVGRRDFHERKTRCTGVRLDHWAELENRRYGNLGRKLSGPVVWTRCWTLYRSDDRLCHVEVASCVFEAEENDDDV